MISKQIVFPESLTVDLIAPCGMNCGLCSAHLRRKKHCVGCNGDDAGKPSFCVVCRIRHCEEMASGGQGFCFGCQKFPCARLRRLDKRYRARYGMSMVDNLTRIREIGPERFVASERERWRCPECGGIVCVHKPSCLYCGRARG